MTIQKAIEHFKNHQRTSLKKRTQEGYKKLLERFQGDFNDRENLSGQRNYADSLKPLRRVWPKLPVD
jgi:hypothetical protein